MFTYINASTIGEGIEKALIALRDNGIIESRENQTNSDETKEIQLCMDIITPTEEPFISKCIITDLEGLNNYDKEFIDGTGDGKGWDYTYHELYSKYYDKLIAELNRNPHTRRACIALGQGDINFTSNPPCLQLIICNVVKNKLEMTILFRSNDAVKAFPMNIHAIQMLHEKIAKEINLECGPLHYIANNFHCYSKDYDRLNGYCKIFETAPIERRFFSREELEEYSE